MAPAFAPPRHPSCFDWRLIPACLAMASAGLPWHWPTMRFSWTNYDGASFSAEIPIPLPQWMQQPVVRYAMPYEVVAAGPEEQLPRPATEHGEAETSPAAAKSPAPPPATAREASTALAGAIEARPAALKWRPHAGELPGPPPGPPWDVPPPPGLPAPASTSTTAQSPPIASVEVPSTSCSSLLAALVPAGRGSHARRPQPCTLRA